MILLHICILFVYWYEFRKEVGLIFPHALLCQTHISNWRLVQYQHSNLPPAACLAVLCESHSLPQWHHKEARQQCPLNDNPVTRYWLICNQPHLLSHMGPLYHMQPAKICLQEVSVRLVSVRAADLDRVCFGTATEILIRSWHTWIILFTLWGDSSHFRLQVWILKKGIVECRVFFDGMLFEVLGQK